MRRRRRVAHSVRRRHARTCDTVDTYPPLSRCRPPVDDTGVDNGRRESSHKPRNLQRSTKFDRRRRHTPASSVTSPSNGRVPKRDRSGATPSGLSSALLWLRGAQSRGILIPSGFVERERRTGDLGAAVTGRRRHQLLLLERRRTAQCHTRSEAAALGAARAAAAVKAISFPR